MAVYYLMMEAVPKPDNPEGRELGGAYVNCWVRAASKRAAEKKAREYIDAENWVYIKTEEAFIPDRRSYLDELDSLKCYDAACENGISAVFYTWPVHEGGIN